LSNAYKNIMQNRKQDLIVLTLIGGEWGGDRMIKALAPHLSLDLCSFFYVNLLPEAWQDWPAASNPGNLPAILLFEKARKIEMLLTGDVIL